MATKAEFKKFATPDEVRTFTHGKVELVNISGGTVGRLILEPGWRWSEDVKPIAGTEWCTAPHFQYLVSGRLHIKMADGTEFELGPGDVSNLPANHDAWVVGNEAAVLVDWYGAGNFAKS
jgi:uncharacterized cupin superfamily protein